ncbi:Cdc6/Cdc18 family protein [Candidatus Acidianus copahuensis]|uniref:ORC1-type DNA replication protein n=1 Tax=Candidatus Acidianus copahuensis TaxID=1160895 RepID=A0A031LT67_9CREN|nr:AAA family ATPase [Candidatus Acidianus copahuensis]EZQ11001.1 cell division control protein Cdc6 [Candidatus Acidianus copahuensis]NON63229.1 AAA family ATPase [Acidianus sp. RZ1]
MIRETLKGGKGEVIKDPKVFIDPISVFTEIPYREEIIRETAIAIRYFVKNDVRFSNLFLGLTGTGKTFVVKYILNEIEEVKKEDIDYSRVRQAYINCREVGGTPQAVLSVLAEKLTNDIVPRHGINLGEYIEKIKGVMREDKALVYLDEVDTLVKRREGDIVLYQLLRADTKISLIMISNDINVRDYMEPRVLSSLGPSVIFKPYDAEQLKEILSIYAEYGLYRGTYNDEILSYIAAISAKEHGDARKAVNLLFRAAQLASGEGLVRKDHVDRAIVEYEQERLVEAIKSLPFHYKLALRAAVESDDVVTAHKIYVDLCNKMKQRPLSYRRFSDILSELDMFGIIKIKILNKGRAGGIRKYIEINEKAKILKALDENILQEMGYEYE